MMPKVAKDLYLYQTVSWRRSACVLHALAPLNYTVMISPSFSRSITKGKRAMYYTDKRLCYGNKVYSYFFMNERWKFSKALTYSSTPGHKHVNR